MEPCFYSPNTASWCGQAQLYTCASLPDHLKRPSDAKVLLTLDRGLRLRALNGWPFVPRAKEHHACKHYTCLWGLKGRRSALYLQRRHKIRPFVCATDTRLRVVLNIVTSRSTTPTARSVLSVLAILNVRRQPRGFSFTFPLSLGQP